MFSCGSRRLLPVIARRVFLFAWMTSAWILPLPLSAQSKAPTIGGFHPLPPTVPTRQRRDLTQGDEGTPLQTAPNASVGSFIESIKGNDAAFQVVVGQSRLLTLQQRVANPDNSTVVAVGDPSIADFQVLPNSKLIRVLGLRPGITDLTVTTADQETVSFEVHVTYDTTLLEARLRQMFPSAFLKLAQLRDHLVVEGQARSASQATQIVETLEAYLESLETRSDQQSRAIDNSFARNLASNDSQNPDETYLPDGTSIELGGVDAISAQRVGGRVINLIRVPGAQQVLLKVRIAELNRTAMREIGSDILAVDPETGNIVGTRIGGAIVEATSIAGLGGLLGTATTELGTSNTAFGIFPSGDFQIILSALRENGYVRVLAEPNLITMSGFRANFLAGGEFPVPIPQSTGAGTNSVTVEFREFGVRLDFLPFVIDEDRIRLSVTPEVSTIDESLGTTLVIGGDPVPGLNTRRANTTVELQEGQTLAMAGLLQVELDGRTTRIPGLGDLPYIGPLFSNTTHERVEKELLVLVTPHLVQPIEEGACLAMPGDSIEDPTDKELYLYNRYEGHTGVNHRSTVEYFPMHRRRQIQYEKRYVSGPVGFSD